MGYYIEVPHHQQKAQQLMELYDAIPVSFPEWSDADEDHVLVCVIQNGPFDAAGIAFSEDEFNEFNEFDGRPRTWLLMTREQVLKLNPYAPI